MLLIALLAGLQATQPVDSPTAARAESHVSVRIVRGARVERGRSVEPHSRGLAVVRDADGERRSIRLVEFQ